MRCYFDSMCVADVTRPPVPACAESKGRWWNGWGGSADKMTSLSGDRSSKLQPPSSCHWARQTSEQTNPNRKWFRIRTHTHTSLVCYRWNSKTRIFFTLVLILGVGVHPMWCAAVSGFPSFSGSGPASSTQSPSEEDALARLSKVFGISRIPARIMHRTPPQYMTDLYSTVADRRGLTKAIGPYNANTIRSFPDRDTVHQFHFHYNVSHLANDVTEEERMLEAEFHIFKMKPRPTRSLETPPPHHLQLKVYQVVDMDNINSPEGLKLLDARRISAHAHGWLTFKVTKAVENWRKSLDPNHGLLITAQSVNGQYTGSYLRFAQRNQHHDSKQPILVVFTDDGKVRHPTYVSPDDQDYLDIQEEINHSDEEEGKGEDDAEQTGADTVDTESEPAQQAGFSRTSNNFRQAIQMLNERDREEQTSVSTSGQSPKAGRRRKRESSGSAGPGVGKKKKKQMGRRKRTYEMGNYRFRRSCTRHKMYVDFDEIGWSGWIISPKGYDAYHCSGECPFPLGQSQKPTNHATVQSIVHALRVGNNVGTPCCVPNKLFSISLLYFDDDENVILKQYDDMVAASCGCH